MTKSGCDLLRRVEKSGGQLDFVRATFGQGKMNNPRRATRMGIPIASVPIDRVERYGGLAALYYKLKGSDVKEFCYLREIGIWASTVLDGHSVEAVLFAYKTFSTGKEMYLQAGGDYVISMVQLAPLTSVLEDTHLVYDGRGDWHDGGRFDSVVGARDKGGDGAIAVADGISQRGTKAGSRHIPARQRLRAIHPEGFV